MADHLKALQEAQKGKAPAPIEAPALVHAPNCDCHKRSISGDAFLPPQNKKLKPSPLTYTRHLCCIKLDPRTSLLQAL
jgi:hypothetical protein